MGGVLSSAPTEGSSSFCIFPGLALSVSTAHLCLGDGTYMKPVGPGITELTLFFQRLTITACRDCVFVPTRSCFSASLDGVLHLHLPSTSAKEIVRGINKPTDNGRHTLMVLLPFLLVHDGAD